MKSIQKALLCIAVLVLMLVTGFAASTGITPASAELKYKDWEKLGDFALITEIPKISPMITVHPIESIDPGIMAHPGITMKPIITSVPTVTTEIPTVTTAVPATIDIGSFDIWLPSPIVTLKPDTTVTPATTGAGTSALPVITKDPTDETVNEGGECWFIANYSNALYAVWHFISPDGLTDYRYDAPAVPTQFPGLKIENGMYSNLHLSNIPYALNGWRVTCEYSNSYGSTRTKTATVNVLPAASAATTPTTTPTTTP